MGTSLVQYQVFSSTIEKEYKVNAAAEWRTLAWSKQNNIPFGAGSSL